jgi:hypothetical protein
MDGDMRSIRSRLRPSIQSNASGIGGDIGFSSEATASIMSDISAYGMNEMNFNGGNNGMLLDARNQQNSMSNFASMPNNNNFMNTGASSINLTQAMMMNNDNSTRSNNDRRRLFAKMKFARQPGSRTSSLRSDQDGMPDIHMVDSNFSLLSNLSGHGSRHERGGLSNLSGHGMSNMSGHGLSNLSGHGFSMNTSGHGDAMMMDPLGVGSRRSLMSGLSRISDHSANSVFSDLSKKLGSTSISNRSIAMSEVSGIDEEDDGSDQDEFHYDIVPPTKLG